MRGWRPYALMGRYCGGGHYWQNGALGGQTLPCPAHSCGGWALRPQLRRSRAPSAVAPACRQPCKSSLLGKRASRRAAALGPLAKRPEKPNSRGNWPNMEAFRMQLPAQLPQIANNGHLVTSRRNNCPKRASGRQKLQSRAPPAPPRAEQQPEHRHGAVGSGQR